MRRLIVILVFVLAACANQPLTQQIANGYALAEDYLDRTERLYDAGVLSNEEAKQRAGLVRSAKTGLDAASVALVQCRASGTPETACEPASARLSTARAVLGQLEVYLLSREVK